MTDTTTTRCSICNHHASDAISAAILAGVELRVIAERWDGAISTSSLSRHAQQHLAPALRAQARDSPVAPTDLLLRLIDVADSARSARLEAEATGTPVQRTRSADLEVKVLQSLLGQYGVNASSTGQALQDAERLVRAVGRYAVNNPLAAGTLIREIKSGGLEGFANDLDSLVSKQSRSLERTTS
jgi:hypothetical protein